MAQIICYLVVYIVEALIAWQFFSGLYKSSKSNFAQLVVFVVAYMGIFLVSQADIFWINIIFFCVLNMVLAKGLFYATFKSTLFFSVILTALMCITELVVVSIMGGIYEDFGVYKKELLYLILSAVLCKTVYFFLLQIILKLFSDRTKKQNDKGAMMVLLCVVPCVTVWCTITYVFVGFYGNIPRQFEWMTIASAILMLVINVIIFAVYNYTQKLSREYLDVQLQLQKENADKNYYQLLAKQTEDQKILIHDIGKHLNAVYTLMDDAEYDSAKQYLQNITMSPELKKQMSMSDNTSLNMLLSYYQNICEEQKIRLEADIRKRSVDFMSFEDITSIFGNLLENAVESCQKVPESYIELSVRKIDDKNVLISMVNNCMEVPYQQPDGTFVSAKKDKNNHGIGIKSIKKVVKKYSGDFKAYYNKEDCTFHTIIRLMMQ